MQARIALVNTALTAMGMWVLMIPGTGLLSLFVFLCSFIPIAGCFISTVPIGFVALTEYGFLKVHSIWPNRTLPMCLLSTSKAAELSAFPSSLPQCILLATTEASSASFFFSN